MESSFCIKAVEEAFSKNDKQEIFNTDQGTQFTSEAFTVMLKQHGIGISMDGKGRRRDKVFVGRVWKSIKYEEVYHHAYEAVQEARNSIGKYLDFYNSSRPHSSLDGFTPDQIYFNRLRNRWQPEQNQGCRCAATYRMSYSRHGESVGPMGKEMPGTGTSRSQRSSASTSSNRLFLGGLLSSSVSNSRIVASPTQPLFHRDSEPVNIPRQWSTRPMVWTIRQGTKGISRIEAGEVPSVGS